MKTAPLTAVLALAVVVLLAVTPPPALAEPPPVKVSTVVSAVKSVPESASFDGSPSNPPFDATAMVIVWPGASVAPVYETVYCAVPPSVTALSPTIVQLSSELSPSSSMTVFAWLVATVPAVGFAIVTV